ncbi:uncharacterized protein CMU_031150 [Cryptosporidium muris RN66]|uniref:Rhodanese domain-containing protein n=1 Tax=Cryptosporidium muris (strain RN66) TaxID=441375 RepID=B6AID3_CRYMR|nr:uncharacterized protein CMU_031150 [Cryptosporidium muris RN66]EEA07974.1 hypothetical protein, conserved [Cryptosporidium muris RN66]|eukprot:XP_002142323.1 hypothetical protein [Cryptosporidium muris RN66]
MYTDPPIEFERLIEDARHTLKCIKEDVRLPCKIISNKKLYNILQLVIKRGNEFPGDYPKVTICDIRSHYKYLSSDHIYSAVNYDTIEIVKENVKPMRDSSDIINNVIHYILYDEDGEICNQIENPTNKIIVYLSKSLHRVKSIHLLKGGYNCFYNEFPYLCISNDAEKCQISVTPSLSDINNIFKSKAISALQYPVIFGWSDNYKIYLANVFQGCHPEITNQLMIKTIIDYTTNGIYPKNRDIHYFHISNAEEQIDEYYINQEGRYSSSLTNSILPFEETIKLLKQLLSEHSNKLDQIFPIMIVAVDLDNSKVAIAAAIISYFRNWPITTSLIFILNQLGLDNLIIQKDSLLYKLLHPSNEHISQLLKINLK